VRRIDPAVVVPNKENYSERNDFTGFAMAALIAWKHTVINAISCKQNYQAIYA
jgi:hypothetical protein